MPLVLPFRFPSIDILYPSNKTSSRVTSKKKSLERSSWFFSEFHRKFPWGFLLKFSLTFFQDFFYEVQQKISYDDPSRKAPLKFLFRSFHGSFLRTSPGTSFQDFLRFVHHESLWKCFRNTWEDLRLFWKSLQKFSQKPLWSFCESFFRSLTENSL